MGVLRKKNKDNRRKVIEKYFGIYESVITCLIWFLTCLIRLREGLAYVLASVVQAFCDVLVLAINMIIEGEIDPMI